MPDLLKYLARGHCANWGTEHYNGDQAHVCAAIALVRIADPESVAPIIALIDGEKPEVRVLARRALTDLFAADVPPDRCLVSADGALKQVRVDELPPAPPGSPNILMLFSDEHHWRYAGFNGYQKMYGFDRRPVLESDEEGNLFYSWYSRTSHDWTQPLPYRSRGGRTMLETAGPADDGWSSTGTGTCGVSD